MGGFLTDDDIAALRPAEEAMFASPIPTQVVSSDEFWPIPQTERQKQVEARIKDMADTIGPRQGMDRRRFLQTNAGMAAAFLAMNEVYGPLYAVSRAEAQTAGAADMRTAALRQQFIMDVHTHFLRPDTRIMTFVNARRAVGRAGWNPDLVGREQTIQDLMEANWFKEVFLDSDTKVALISGAPSEEAIDWFLTNDMKFDARKRVNDAAGNKRVLSHAIFTPGKPGWMDEVERCIEQLRPDSWKGYTIGDNTNKHLAIHPWRMDDERLMYPFYERILRAGNNIVCVHKGLFPPQVEQQFPHLTPYARVDDVGKAARDWPQINFVIYHSAYRFAGGGRAEQGWAQFQQTGRVDWVSDLAEIPAKYGVSNVYGDLGQIFAQSTVVEPQLCAAMMGILIKGLGADHVVWGTDAIWTGSPQWQIESLRRLEIPEEMQRRYGFAPLGAPDGPVKNAIFGETSARMYNYTRRAALESDGVARVKADYALNGAGRSNLAYGYVAAG
ncbi:amidohydrolase family protein [Sediminicoccus rosea]|uniref:Amidohydrolase family protein n=1 Tax=Sediminicoccus rosea TaxID=1225128 RepID=A0ABZ0PMT0_9PROT|nr:amidohydrolase family protein [Sediminicoccus rosea]WPB86855.1 amidohydrolase family protein [Sediminicoccus rosea]